MERHEVKELVEDLIHGKIKAGTAIAQIMNEMSRGHWHFVVDKNIINVTDALRRLMYSSTTVFPLHAKDEAIKRSGQLAGKIFVTNNGQDFDYQEEMDEFQYGMIWWATDVQRDPEIIAAGVDKAIKAGFFNDKIVGVLVKIVQDPNNSERFIPVKTTPGSKPKKSKRKIIRDS